MNGKIMLSFMKGAIAIPPSLVKPLVAGLLCAVFAGSTQIGAAMVSTTPTSVSNISYEQQLEDRNGKKPAIEVNLDDVSIKNIDEAEEMQPIAVYAKSVQSSGNPDNTIVYFSDELSEIDATEGSGFLKAIESTEGSGFVKTEPTPEAFNIEAAIAKYRSQMDEATIVAIAKALWGEARGIKSTAEKAAVVWTVFNRVDSGYGTAYSCVTNRSMYEGYSYGNPVWPELYDLVIDVWARWLAEKDGVEDVGRVLPVEYRWFRSSGDGHNIFRDEYKRPYNIWNWSLPDPYVN